jgi:hypothetical protein
VGGPQQGGSRVLDQVCLRRHRSVIATEKLPVVFPDRPRPAARFLAATPPESNSGSTWGCCSSAAISISRRKRSPPTQAELRGEHPERHAALVPEILHQIHGGHLAAPEPVAIG